MKAGEKWLVKIGNDPKLVIRHVWHMTSLEEGLNFYTKKHYVILRKDTPWWCFWKEYQKDSYLLSDIEAVCQAG